MPRRPRPPKTSRSEHWLRIAVNEHTELLSDQTCKTFGFSTNEKIKWLSPIVSDDYAEYYDKSFLERLEINDSNAPLSTFWPASGPRWDGLAKTSGGKVILVEAKAYIAEAVDFGSKAGPTSTELIEASLTRTKTAFRARSEAVWSRPFYQYANRLAHLYYLREIAGVDAYLLFVCVTDAPDVPIPASSAQWQGAISAIECALGLGVHPFRKYIGHLFWAAPRNAA